MELKKIVDRIFTILKLDRGLIILLPLFFMVSCNNPTFKISGELPDSKYDGEWVFLVPMEEHTVDDVDSVIIENSSFVFQGNIERVAVIRMPMKQRMQIQELLVVTEPGEINVKLDSVSSAAGTPQNDALQRWKNYRAESFTKLGLAREMEKTDPDNDLHEKIRNDLKAFNYKLLKETGDNTLGDFLYNTVKVAIPDEKRAELDSIFKIN